MGCNLWPRTASKERGASGFDVKEAIFYPRRGRPKRIYTNEELTDGNDD